MDDTVFGFHVSHEKALIVAVNSILRSYGVRGLVATGRSEMGRYLTFEVYEGGRRTAAWDLPVANRSNSTQRQLADDVAEHLLEILTRPEVA
jgi:hypothetical protein